MLPMFEGRIKKSGMKVKNYIQRELLHFNAKGSVKSQSPDTHQGNSAFFLPSPFCFYAKANSFQTIFLHCPKTNKGLGLSLLKRRT